jgi:predicted ATPase
MEKQQFAGWIIAEGYVTQAEVLLNKRDITEALAALVELQELAATDGGNWLEAEGVRLKGECLLMQSADQSNEVESCFHQAITIAQNQSAKSWELRAATNLARLWQTQGKREVARELLVQVYEWFTEGFDTADLIDAKALLDELA